MTMTAIYHHECAKCAADIECEVDVFEHFVDVPESCDECGRKIVGKERIEIYTTALNAVLADEIDRAHDMRKDR